MRRYLSLVFIFLIVGRAALASPTTQQAVSLVRSFYVAHYNQDKMPLSARLDRYFKAASARHEPVAGLDFDWTANCQDAEAGWQKSARFSTLRQRPGHVTVRVRFRNNQRDGDLRYDLVTEKGHWVVDEITSVAGEKWVLSQMLARGAKGEY